MRAEARLTPKPGLVDSDNRGAHRDLTLELMLASADALEPEFVKMAALGATPGWSVARLQALGRDAEQVMLSATGGVNTHRGAIFALGWLAAAAGGQPSADEARAPRPERPPVSSPDVEQTPDRSQADSPGAVFPSPRAADRSRVAAVRTTGPAGGFGSHDGRPAVRAADMKIGLVSTITEGGATPWGAVSSESRRRASATGLDEPAAVTGLEDSAAGLASERLAARVGRLTKPVLAAWLEASPAPAGRRPRGARGEAAAAFATVTRHCLPALRRALNAGWAEDDALLAALVASLARLEDSNLIARGGRAALRAVQGWAAALERAAVPPDQLRSHLARADRWLTGWGLSPGGSADLVAVTWLLHRFDSGDNLLERPTSTEAERSRGGA
ncbi:MAG: triphosphoribosyl-dephospho-CoA synthase [Propionibacteriaceae bacterium]|nr:triphosphoribosyl-dephospho-CoA synthase [Propionibacteriaceae bacterium]